MEVDIVVKLSVILDTTILRRDPSRSKLDFRSLSFYSRNQHIDLYLPSIVRDEFISQELENSRESLVRLGSSLRDVMRLGREEVPKEVREFSNYIASNTLAIESAPGRVFYNWLSSCKIRIVDVNFDHMQGMLYAYFGGYAPFPTVRSRKDIPDSLIYEAVSELSLKISGLIFVCGDNNLRESASRNLRVTVFESIESLFKSSLMKEYIELISEQVDAERIEFVLSNITRFEDDLASKSLFVIAPHVEKFDRVEINAISRVEAQVIAFSGLTVSKIDKASVTYYSGRTFSLDYLGELELQLNYVIPLDHFQRLTNSTRNVTGDNAGESSVVVTELISAKVSGRISISFESRDWQVIHLDLTGLSEAIKSADMRSEEITIETIKYDRFEYDEYELYVDEVEEHRYEEDIINEYHSIIHRIEEANYYTGVKNENTKTLTSEDVEDDDLPF